MIVKVAILQKLLYRDELVEFSCESLSLQSYQIAIGFEQVVGDMFSSVSFVLANYEPETDT